MKNFIKNRKNLRVIVNSMLIILLIALALFSGVAHNNSKAEFTLDELASNYSNVPLAGDAKEQQTEEGQQDQEESEQQKLEQVDEQTQLTLENPQAKKETKKSEDEPTKNESSPASDEDNTNEKSETDVEITGDAQGENEFFTTTIVDNEIVTVENYFFTIEHKNSELKLAELKVSLNKQNIQDFNGGIKLKEGNNAIKIDVNYEREDGVQLHASRTYNVILNTKDIIIDTNLQDHFESNEAVLTFTASAKRNGQTVPVEVTLNKEQIKSLGGTAYKTNLKEGQNNLIIRASEAKDEVKREIRINYSVMKSKIELSTDLKDQKVEIDAFKFYAKAEANGEVVPLQISLNDTPISPGDNDNYQVTLKEGTNVITLEGEYSEELLIRQFKILYKNPNAIPEETLKDPKSPVLKTDLVNNAQVQGNIKTFNVWPVDANSKRIRGNKVAVSNNGVGVPYVWDDSTKTSYKLTLREGENKVAIRIWDDDGRSTTENFIVHSTVVKDGDVIGKATISVEASTVGLGYLIPPTKVDIRQNEKTSYLLDQLLRNNGFTYGKTGTLDNSFYLKEISKPGLMQNAKIPSDLRDLVEQASTRFSEEDYYMDSLGEFDFANGSGWMYSVNGDYPNYGFSDSYLLDGDVIRIRFTLHYGKDIGGFGSMGGETGQDWQKEW